MRKQLRILTDTHYDALIIGGGITGMFIAWDAVLRGLKVALIERGDFGGATSSNSMKTVHGGLRYLKDGNISTVRKMIKERQAFLNIAPHIIHPLPFIMPTMNSLMNSKHAIQIALILNDLIGFDRNSSNDVQKQLLNGYVVSKSDFENMYPNLKNEAFTGAGIWYDAQITNSERFLISIMNATIQRGANIINYVQAEDLIQENNRIMGVSAIDCLTQIPLEIHAKCVVNAAGAWIDRLLQGHAKASSAPKFNVSVAINLVTKQVFSDHAVAIPPLKENNNPTSSRQHNDMVILVPWRKKSIIGTFHQHYHGNPDDFSISEVDLEYYIDLVNRTCQSIVVTRDNIHRVHYGFLPAQSLDSDTVNLVRNGMIHDHKIIDDIDGLVSVVGVKYTTARYLAQQSVNLLFQKLKQPSKPCTTHQTPLWGGHINNYDQYVTEQIQKHADNLQPEIIKHLISNYGSEYMQVLHYSRSPADNSRLHPKFDVIQAEVLHTIHEELAVKLSDVVMRRLIMGSFGNFEQSIIDSVCDIMASELGWNEARQQQEKTELVHTLDQYNVLITSNVSEKV